MKKIITISFLLILLSSCEKDANVKLPEGEIVPVVISFLNPDTDKIVVRVNWSDYAFSHDPLEREPIHDATVTISDGTLSANLIYDSNNEWFEIDTTSYKIIAGKNYTVNVTTANGKVANGNTTIPINKINSLSNFNQDTVVTYQNSGSTYFDVNGTIEWIDIPNETNYYEIAIYSISVYPPTNDTSYSYHYSYYSSDYDKDGQALNYQWFYNGNSHVNSYNSVGTRIIICNVNYDYYQYHKTVQAGAYSDPFSEPVLIYSNVNGGLGVISGYHQTIFDFMY